MEQPEHPGNSSEEELIELVDMDSDLYEAYEILKKEEDTYQAPDDEDDDNF